MTRYPRAPKLRGKKVVIKFGGSSIENPAELERFAKDMALLVSLGIRPVIGPRRRSGDHRGDEEEGPSGQEGARAEDHRRCDLGGGQGRALPHQRQGGQGLADRRPERHRSGRDRMQHHPMQKDAPDQGQGRERKGDRGRPGMGRGASTVRPKDHGPSGEAGLRSGHLPHLR